MMPPALRNKSYKGQATKRLVRMSPSALVDAPSIPTGAGVVAGLLKDENNNEATMPSQPVSASFTLIGTLAAQYFGRRATSRELDRMLAEQRTRALNERFATAAYKLGSDKSSVRLAGTRNGRDA
jgi:hypothetical protein